MVAQFEEKQVRWLVDVTGRQPVESLGGDLPNDLPVGEGESAIERQEAWLATVAKKEKRLQAVRSKLENGKSQIHALMEIEVTLQDGTRVKAFSGSKLWDPNEEFDAVHHTHLTTTDSLSGAEIERLKIGCEKLADLRNLLTGTVAAKDWPTIYQQHIQQQRSVDDVADEWLVSPETIARVVEQYSGLLQKEGVDPNDPSFARFLQDQKPVRDEQPLFSDLEIRKEFFDPLVREKIIPDNEVEDRYNQSYQVFTGASSEYKDALREFSLEAEEDPELTQLRQFTTTGIKSVAKIGTDLAGILGKLSETQEVVDMAKLAGDVLKITEQVGLLAVTSIDQYYGKQAEGIVDQVGGVLESALKASLGQDAADYAKWVRAGYTSLVNAKEVADALMKREQGWVDQALEQLAGGLESALSIGGNEDAERIGKKLKHALMAKVNGSKIYDYLTQDPPAVELVVATLAKAATAACKDVLGDPGVVDQTSGVQEVIGGDSTDVLTEEQTNEKEAQKKEAEDEYNDALEEIAGEIEGGLDEVIGTIEEARQSTEDLKRELSNPETLKLLTQKLEAESTERLTSDIESELKALPGGSVPDEDENLEKEFVAIQPLIADVKKSGVYLKLADSLLDAGLKAVGEFVAVVKVAAAGKTLLKNILVAYGKKRQLYQWKVLREDALAAATITSSSFAAKVKDLEFEFSEARYKEWLSVAETLGASLTTILDPTGIAGEVISKSASSGSALLDIVLEGRKASDLARAWQAYLEALRNPGDRIMLREAIERNSTLAKYALAYAALHDGDRLAKAGLAEVGLTEEVLRDPSAKVRDVVIYLEAKWASDPSNMKKVYLPQDWQSDTSGDLTLDAWMSNMDAARGEKLGDDKVVKGDTGVVEGAFLALDQARSTRDDAVQAIQQFGNTFDGIAEEMADALNIYQPCRGLCDGLKAELRKVQKLATAANRELKVKRQEESWADTTQRAEIFKTHLEVLVKARLEKRLANIAERINDYYDAADLTLPRTTTFLQRSESYLELLEQLPLKQQAQVDRLLTLRKSLRTCQLQRADGQPSELALRYVRSVLNRVEDEIDKEQASSAHQEKRFIDLQTRRREAEMLPADIADKRKELAKLEQQTERFQTQYREYFIARKKEWDEARRG